CRWARSGRCSARPTTSCASRPRTCPTRASATRPRRAASTACSTAGWPTANGWPPTSTRPPTSPPIRGARATRGGRSIWPTSPTYGAGSTPSAPARPSRAACRFRAEMPGARRLERLSRLPEGAARGRPLLFVHGAYTGAWCWDEHFLPFFARHGYAAHAVSLSGHGGSEGRERLDRLRLADYVDDVARTVAELPAPPVLIGHSMGGLIVQKYLEHADATAAALLCAVPPHGLGPA